MLENQNPTRKPLFYYIAIALTIIFLLNAFVFPSLLARQVQEVGYSDFLQWVDAGKVSEVSLDSENDQIVFLAANGESGEIVYKTAVWGVSGLRAFCQPAINALARSKRFSPPMHIDRIADLAKPVLSIGNQYGEGWLLCGEMAELLEQGVHNIVCIQPFGCLPNHVVGKGVIKQLKRKYPKANIAAVDYDPGASEVNQMNRIKLMLSQACVKQM